MAYSLDTTSNVRFRRGAGDGRHARGRRVPACSRATRERVQAESLLRPSEELPISPSFLPQLFEDAAQPSAIRDLAKRMV